MPQFEPARALCGRFYREVLAPVIGVPHSAGLLGPGSDVLGYDTERSTDHDWGPRATVFVEADRVDEVAARVAAALPESFGGWPVRIGRDGMPLEAHVEVTTLGAWLHGQFGFDPRGTAGAPGIIDWLVLPQQRLLGLAGGEVFADDSGELDRARAALRRYPDEVWWWLIASQWRRLDQEEPFVARAAELNDGLGSAVIAARQVRDCMRLALLLAREYAPYSKWLGTAFGHVPDADGLGEMLRTVLAADTVTDRQGALGEAYRLLARRFNAVYPGQSVDDGLRAFHQRPAVVLGAERFAAAALSVVRDESLRRVPLIGSIDQMVDSTDVLSSPERCAAFRSFYGALTVLPSYGA
jgi:hypothetical protein